jgi:Ca2+-binding RTX toxin-like protein
MPDSPETWLDGQIVNTTVIPGFVGYLNDIAQLANGNILVTWASDHTTGDGSPAGTEVFGQLFDPLGARIGAEFRVNQLAQNDDEGDSDIVVLPGGGFIVIYHDENLDGLGGSNILLEEFDADGGPVSESAVVILDDIGAGVPNYANPRGAASSDTSVLITYDKITASGTGIYAKVYNPATDTYGAEITVMTAVDSRESDVTVLQNGNYVIVAERSATDDAIRFCILDDAGGTVLAPAAVTGTNTNSDADNYPSVTALTGGGFVIVWIAAAADTSIQFALYDSAGTELDTGTVGNVFFSNVDNSPVVTGLADGGFVVAYRDDSGHQVTHLDAAGVELGTFDYASTADFPSITGLADGRFAISYTDNLDQVQMEILDTRDGPNTIGVNYAETSWQVGTAGDDVFTSAANIGVVHGHGGNDLITESSGSNLIFGDAGNDILFVNTTIGSDGFFGGDGRDQVNWTSSSETGATFDLEAGTATNSSATNVEQMEGFEEIGGTAQNDSMFGTADSNNLYGQAGDDTINGRSGGDIMEGGDGNDLIYADDLADYVLEYAGGGTFDRVACSVTYVLRLGVDVEQLQTTSSTGTGAINLTGNALAQGIFGNAGDNILSDGGTGASDTLTGSAGNDTYKVYNTGTVVVEGVAAGTNDRVAAGVSFVLAGDDDIEVMTTTSSSGVTAINLTGNMLAQTIIGNAGINTLSDGGAGAGDTLTGLGGDDLYKVYNAGSLIVEGAGQGTNDRVAAGVSFVLAGDDNTEVMTTTSSSGVTAINLTGNALVQSITGNAGGNRLDGGAGNDTLTGSGGADTFVFTTATGAANVDDITDFILLDDTIELENAIFTGLATGGLAAADFVINSTGLAGDASDRVIYNSTNGYLYFDADGTGAGGRVRFVLLDTGLALTAADIFVV